MKREGFISVLICLGRAVHARAVSAGALRATMACVAPVKLVLQLRFAYRRLPRVIECTQVLHTEVGEALFGVPLGYFSKQVLSSLSRLLRLLRCRISEQFRLCLRKLGLVVPAYKDSILVEFPRSQVRLEVWVWMISAYQTFAPTISLIGCPVANHVKGRKLGNSPTVPVEAFNQILDIVLGFLAGLKSRCFLHLFQLGLYLTPLAHRRECIEEQSCARKKQACRRHRIAELTERGNVSRIGHVTPHPHSPHCYGNQTGAHRHFELTVTHSCLQECISRHDAKSSLDSATEVETL